MPRKAKPSSKAASENRTKRKVKKGKGLASDTYVKVANKLTGSKLKKGEVHAPQLTRKGIKMGKYIGPGTQVADRVRRGDKPVSKTDKVAQAHDLRYGFAGTDKKKIRAADVKMLKKLAKLTVTGQDNAINTFIGTVPIMSKIALEDAGLAGPSTFTDMEGKPMTTADRKMLQSKLSELEQEGYGLPRGKRSVGTGKPKAKKKRPPSAWVTHCKTYAKKNGCSYREALSAAGPSYRKSKK